MKVAFLTLGCKVNAYETERMKKQFMEAGYDIVSFTQKADIYIVNTCTVTNIADRKSRKMLHRARKMNEKAVVVAAGCYAEAAERRGERDGSVDLFLRNSDKEEMVQTLQRLLDEREREQAGDVASSEPDDRMNRSDGEAGTAGQMSEEAAGEERTRAYIQIQNGCNQFCSYCIIPYVRGALTSRPDSGILQEVREMASGGIHEIVLTGIHLSSFGVERSGGAHPDRIDADAFVEQKGRPLLMLLERLSEVEGIERIRLGSLEPRIITEEFVERLAAIPKVCPHFHLSLQSGCDETLRRMNRHYTTEEYRGGVALLQKYFEHPAVTTDIIVGFPQESDGEFETTCAFAREMGFAQIHVFKFSRRQGTVADRMQGQISEQVKGERSKRLLELAGELEQNYQEYFLGKEEKVLLEEVSRIGDREYLVGYNERYVRIAVPVQEVGDGEDACNRMASVRVTGRLNGEVLQAEFMSFLPVEDGR